MSTRRVDTAQEKGSGRDIVVVGASAGGVEALRTFVAGLDPELPASVFVVLHVLTTGTSVLPGILDRAGPLPAAHAVDGDHIEHGRIYVAPPNAHLLLERGMIRLSRGPKENGHRPAIDPLFRSAARVYAERAVGVLLSGVLDDGSAGLQVIKRAGGATVVQDPADALYPMMPRNAINYVDPDHVAPVAEIPPLLGRLVVSPPSAPRATLAPSELTGGGQGSTHPQPGAPTGFTCPDCGGGLWETDESGLLRFRCRVGHEYSVDSVMAMQGEALESALWGALRALEERAALNRRLAEPVTGRAKAAYGRFERRAQDADRHASVLRDVLLNLETVAEVEIEPAAEAKA